MRFFAHISCRYHSFYYICDMNVKELIKELQKLPQNSIVCIRPNLIGYEEVKSIDTVRTKKKVFEESSLCMGDDGIELVKYPVVRFLPTEKKTKVKNIVELSIYPK